MTMKKANIVTALASMIFSSVIGFFAVKMPAGSQGVPGPGVFPLLVCAMMFLSGAVVLAGAVRDKAAEQMELIPEEARSRVLLLMAALVIYVGAVFLLGYLTASVLFITAVIRWIGKYSWIRCLAAGAGIALAVYLVFTQVLNVPLYFGLLM